MEESRKYSILVPSNIWHCERHRHHFQEHLQQLTWNWMICACDYWILRLLDSFCAPEVCPSAHFLSESTFVLPTPSGCRVCSSSRKPSSFSESFLWCLCSCLSFMWSWSPGHFPPGSLWDVWPLFRALQLLWHFEVLISSLGGWRLLREIISTSHFFISSWTSWSCLSTSDRDLWHHRDVARYQRAPVWETLWH